MSLKYKLIILIVLIIIVSSLPLSLFILDRFEESTISRIKHHQKITAKILAESTIGILLMNGGELNAARIECKERIENLRPLTIDGLVYAEAIFLPADKHKDGLVLASMNGKGFSVLPHPDKNKVSGHELSRLKQNKTGFSEIGIPGHPGKYYEFSSIAGLPGGRSLCIGRLLFSRKDVLASVQKIRFVVYFSLFIAVLIASVIGSLSSRVISNPIQSLISGAVRVESGDFGFEVPVRGGDELGKLTSTFNNMTRIIDRTIYELRVSNAELSRLDKLKDEFLANTSHELRTPIHGIIGIAESLIDGAAGNLNESIIHNLSMISVSGKRLSSLVNDILDYSRLKYRDLQLNITSVNLNSVAELVVMFVKPAVDKKSLQIENRIDPDLPGVKGDEDRVLQVLFNLVDNAVKFTAAGTVIISAEYNHEDAEITVSVSDTGPGITSENIKRIFESFEQGDGSVSRKYGGTGLGLSITKDIVELHGGYIWVQSEPDIGSEFCFVLPVSSEICVRESETKFNDNKSLTEKRGNFPLNPDIKIQSRKGSDENTLGRLIVIDDDPVSLQVLINHLSIAGYAVEAASGGNDALKILESANPPDLILLDVMMPGISGYEVCKKIRQEYTLYELPVLLLTAKKDSVDVVTGINMGANDYVAKPFDKEELLSRVANLVRLKKAVEQHNELLVMQHELQVARNIQESILPAELPDIKGLRMHACYEPMGEVGGDLYDFQEIGDTKVGILIADVAGHGVPAAIVGAMLKVVFSVYRSEVAVPDFMMKMMNESICNAAPGQVITANYSYIDLDQMKITLSNAGHWPVLVCRAGEPELMELYTRGLAMGFYPDFSYKIKEFALHEKDRIIFYTDGLIECRNEAGYMYGEENFHASIKSGRDFSTEEFTSHVVGSFIEWIGGRENLEDDVTFVVVDVV